MHVFSCCILCAITVVRGVLAVPWQLGEGGSLLQARSLAKLVQMCVACPHARGLKTGVLVALCGLASSLRTGARQQFCIYSWCPCGELSQ